MGHAVMHFFGLDNAGGPWYLFWSGVAGSFLVNITAVFLLFYWHRTCHAGRCWRLAKFPAAGGMFKVCRHHHPDLKGTRPQARHIAVLHRAWREGNRP